MNRRDIVIGIVILALLAGVVYWIRRPKEPLIDLPETPSIEEQIEESFQTEIPEDVEKTEMIDVTGGASTGIGTRKFEDGVYSHTVLADLPDLELGFYEGWLVTGKEGDEDFDFFSTGRMRLAKGGYILEFSSTTDYSDHQQVVITHELVADATPEDHVLEGSF